MSDKMTPLKIADTFIGMASKAPNARVRSDILRRGAATFAGMASDPSLQNDERARGYLTRIGLELAGAASVALQATTSDFTQLMRDTAQAWEELPEGSTHGTSAMDMISAMPGIAAGGGGAGMPGSPGDSSQRMSIAPASFNKNATLGRQVTVKYAPTPEDILLGIQQSQTAAFWQGVKQEAQAMTVDIGVVIPPLTFDPTTGSGTPTDIRAFATVEYGSDGTKSQATLDVGAGRRLTVVGNYISVIIGMDPPGFGLPPSQMTIGASIGAFAATSLAPVIRTLYFDFLAANVDSAIVPIPAKAVLLLTPAMLGPKGGQPGIVSISFVDGAGVTMSLLQYNTGIIGTQPPYFTIPIPPSAFYVFIKTSLGGRATLPFQLSL